MKLHIKENAISDFRSIVNNLPLDQLADKPSMDYGLKGVSYQKHPMRGELKPATNKGTIKQELLKWVVDILRKGYRYDLNTNDLSVNVVNKPKGPTIAKKNPELLIGIDSNTGNAVLIGKGQFEEFFNGTLGKSSYRWDKSAPDDPMPDYYDAYKYHRVSLKDYWETLDVWLEITPTDPETYQSYRAVKAAKNARPGRDTRFTTYNGKRIYDFEYELYDPEEARRLYANRLKSVKTRREYEDILNSISDINARIDNINFGHPVYDDIDYDVNDVNSLRRKYRVFKAHIDTLNKAIDNNDKIDINNYPKYIQDDLDELNNILQRFNV